jgi:lipoyl(octanoyl) transferase
MNIEIKKSIKPINYFSAIDLLEKRLEDLYKNKDKELIWILEHDEIFTAGTSYKENEILDNSINLIKTNRGGKITCHSPGSTNLLFCFRFKKKKRY